MSSFPTDTTEVLRTPGSWLVKRAGLCGGEACIRGRRFPVWGLVAQHRLGLSDEAILRAHPDLTQADLEAAWEYHRQHPEEIERALWLNTADATRGPGGVPAALLVRARQLGIPDPEIRETFDPPLPQDLIDAAWREYQRDPEATEQAMREILPRELIAE